MLARLRESMAMDTLQPQEQALCEKRIALTERLDHVLFTEWDPIGVHLLEDFDCEGEYDRYLPEIVDMVMDGASLSEIADTLLEFEEMIVGEDLRCRRRCHFAAARILGCSPSSDDSTLALQPDYCGSCLSRVDWPPKTVCIGIVGYGAKPTVHYID